MPLAANENARVSRQFLRDNIYTELRRAIISGELEPGERLRTDEIIERFGGSRFPVRDALSRLSAEGYVVVKPKSGTTVAPIDANQFAQEAVVIGGILAHVVREATPLLTEDDRQALALYRATVLTDPKSGREALQSGRAVTDCYDIFFNRYGNDVLTRMRDTLMPAVMRVFNYVAATHGELLGEGQPTLRRMIDLANVGDANAAAQAMYDYVALIAQTVAAVLAQSAAPEED